jgi:ribose 5-phosphate isomerase B
LLRTADRVELALRGRQLRRSLSRGRRGLEALGHEVVDFGCFTAERCDYPDHCRPAAEAVRSGECHRCIVFGGSGKRRGDRGQPRVRRARAAVWNQETARLGREHNDANGLALGARAIDQELALKIV